MARILVQRDTNIKEYVKLNELIRDTGVIHSAHHFPLNQMGCDIHMWAEIRKRDGWELQPEDPYEGRNYNLFGILADVRNGVGFGGCDTGDGFTPIADPRGIPDDASPEYREQVDMWGIDGHSHSWLTLSEILLFDWQQTTKKRGWVNANGYSAFKRGELHGYCGDVGGGSIRKVSNDEMERRIDAGDTEYVYTQLEWPISYYDAAGSGWWEAVERLKTLAAPEDIRLVFFFDN